MSADKTPLMPLKAGDTVSILGRKRVLICEVTGVDGGWEVNKPVEGFRHWNTADMKAWRPISKALKPKAQETA